MRVFLSVCLCLCARARASFRINICIDQQHMLLFICRDRMHKLPQYQQQQPDGKGPHSVGGGGGSGAGCVAGSLNFQHTVKRFMGLSRKVYMQIFISLV